jgi:hypothetical protein
MRAWWILLATGCWSAPPRPAPPAPVARPTMAGTCTITDRFEDQVPMTPVHLAVDGEVFARPSSLEALELKVDTGRLVKARAETQTTRLLGALDLRNVHVRPRNEMPHEGWLVVKSADVLEAKGRVAHLVLFLPDGVAPRTLDLDLPCSEVTTLPRRDDTPEGDLVVLARDARLRGPSPGSGEVARVVQDALEAHELERHGGMVRVSIDGDESRVEAWVDASSVATPPPGSGTSRGGIGTGRYGTSSSVSCSRDLAIYARSTALGAVHVGYLKPGQSVRVDGKNTTPDETAIELGGDIATFVRASDLAGCKP